MRHSTHNIIRSVNSYAVLKSIYRQLVESRNHFSCQTKMLKQVMAQRKIPKNARILDAAAGTGDVAVALYKAGYKNIRAIDGSSEMLELWPKRGISIPHETVKWERLEAYLKNRRFDFVYFFGHSLPHLPKAKLPKLFKTVFNGLNPGGLLAFDMRNWKVKNRTLMEGDRGKRQLPDVTIEGKVYELYDEVEYIENPATQCVRYVVKSKAGDGETYKARLSYAVYSAENATELLIKEGFINVVRLKIPNWPYLVLLAKRPV